MPTKDRRDLKLKTKLNRTEDGNDIEFFVVETDFNVSKKSTGATDPGGGPFFEGYASIKNSYDSYMDKIVDGAYKESLKEKGPKEVKGKIRSRIKSLWQHNPEWPFGLPHEAQEDTKGLYHKTKVSDTPENMERLTYMEDTVVDGQSIGFVTLDSDWEEDDDDEDMWWPPRILKKLDIWEWSPVTFPAHSEALTELITRNKELLLATRSVDHVALLEQAREMRGITVPAVEEAIATLSTVITQIKHSEAGSDEEEGEAREPENEIPVADEVIIVEDSEADPVEDGETREDDPELVKELEAFAFRSQALAFAQKNKVEAMKIGGR